MRKLFSLSTSPAALPEQAVAGVESMASGAHHAVDRVAGTVAAAARQLGETGHDLMAAQQRWTQASRETVRRHPFSAVAIAVGIGVLLSRIAGR